MPQAVSEDRQALDWLADNPNNPAAGEVMGVLGVDAEDVKAWTYAKQNPDDERNTALRNVVFEKVAAANPAVEEQGVGFLDRFMIKNLISENTDLQQKYLQKKVGTLRVMDRIELLDRILDQKMDRVELLEIMELLYRIIILDQKMDRMEINH